MAKPVLTRRGWFVRFDQDDLGILQDMKLELPPQAHQNSSGIGPMDEDQATKIAREINIKYRDEHRDARK